MEGITKALGISDLIKAICSELKLSEATTYKATRKPLENSFTESWYEETFPQNCDYKTSMLDQEKVCVLWPYT